MSAEQTVQGYFLYFAQLSPAKQTFHLQILSALHQAIRNGTQDEFVEWLRQITGNETDLIDDVQIDLTAAALLDSVDLNP